MTENNNHLSNNKRNPISLVIHNIVTLRCILDHVHRIHIKLLQARSMVNEEEDVGIEHTKMIYGHRYANKSHLLINPSNESISLAQRLSVRPSAGQLKSLIDSSNIHRLFKYKNITRVGWMVDQGYINLLLDKVARKETLTFTQESVQKLCSMGLPLDKFKAIYNQHKREFGDVADCYFYASSGPNSNVAVFKYLQSLLPSASQLAIQLSNISNDFKDSFKLHAEPVGTKRTKDIHFDALINSLQYHYHSKSNIVEPQLDIIKAVAPFITKGFKLLSCYASLIKDKEMMRYLLATFPLMEIAFNTDELYFLHGDDYQLFQTLEKFSPPNSQATISTIFAKYRHYDSDVISKDRIHSFHHLLRKLAKPTDPQVPDYQKLYDTISQLISNETLRWEAVYLEMIAQLYDNHTIVESILIRNLKLALQNEDYWCYLFTNFKRFPPSSIDILLKCGDLVTIEKVIQMRESGHEATQFSLNHCNNVDIMKYLVYEFDLQILPFAITTQIVNNNMELFDYSISRISGTDKKDLSIAIKEAVVMDNYYAFEKLILLHKNGESKMSFECNNQRELHFFTKHYTDLFNYIDFNQVTIIKILAHAGYTGNLSAVMQIHSTYPTCFYCTNIFDKTVVGGHQETLDYLLENRSEGFSSLCWTIVGRIGSVPLYKQLCKHSSINHSYEMIKEAYVYGHKDFLLYLIEEGVHQLNVIYIKHSIEQNQVELLDYYLQRKVNKFNRNNINNNINNNNNNSSSNSSKNNKKSSKKGGPQFRRILSIMASQNFTYLSINMIQCFLKYVPIEMIYASEHSQLKKFLFECNITKGGIIEKDRCNIM